jgi:hypothetical protein
MFTGRVEENEDVRWLSRQQRVLWDSKTR